MNKTDNRWYSDQKSDLSPIISSRVRLARNIKKYPFLARLDQESSKKMVDETVELLGHYFPSAQFAKKTPIEKMSMLERHNVSLEFLKIDKPKELLLQSDEKISIMLNEEDHIRIQTIYPGDDIENAWITANRIDDLIEENVEYAFDKNYGYLTSCPTNTGTGMRASFMAHLPMMERTGNLKHVLATVSKFGYTLRGIYGEGTEPLGDIYQVSNQITLGKSEEEIINGLRKVARQMIEIENRLREKSFADKRLELEDNIYRAYGALAYSRIMSAGEAMDYLSDIRIGCMLDILPMPRPRLPIYQIMMSIQSGSLQWRAGRELDEQERDVARSNLLRDIFKG